MTTINTIDDLLRIVRENEEFRVALRRELLTEDLLALPQRSGEYSATTDKKLNTLTDSVNVLTKSINKLVQHQEEMHGDIRALHGMYRRQHQDVGRFH